ncbi:MAG: membrane protein insertase YidC [Treponema sp.]|nr:membrane protein insertase YidC [Treponema sp.]
MLYNIIIAPIETLIDWVFLFISRKFSALGIMSAVAGVSIAMNFMALPIYNVADSLQEKERKISKKLEERVKRIKKAFKGDEQFMMLQAYYRENNYHPLYVLRSSLSILIELPFFIAAYHYLSNCEALSGASWWIFKDLGSADNLFSIPFGTKVFYINILPIIMTLINFVSGAIYTKEAPAREKIQLYVVAGIFLVLLYNSPSGLVLYWILNNLFSLVKNIVVKMKHPKRIVHIFISLLFFGATLFYLLYKPDTNIWKKALMILITLFTVVFPFCLKIVKRKFNYELQISKKDNKATFIVFLFSSLSLVFLLGYLLPSSLIASSPAEFSFLGNTDSPLFYIKNSFTVFLGLFLFWPLVIYFMFDEKFKFYETLLFFAILICTLFNVYVFKADYGFTDALLKVENNMLLVPKLYFVLPLVIFVISIVLLLTLSKKNKVYIASILLIAITLAEFVLATTKVTSIKKEYKRILANKETENLEENNLTISPVYNLSKTGKNVMIIFLDRAISSFFPYILEQFPEINEQFSGFTYYPNTLSFGNHTVFGFPAITGGYEYNQAEINKRSSELLKDKHNEAELVLPRLFLDAGFNVTYTDPSSPNYEWSGDFTAFEPYPQIKVSEERGKYIEQFKKEMDIQNTSNLDLICKQQMINYCFMEGFYPLLRDIFHRSVRAGTEDEDKFLADFSELYYLDKLTDFSSKENTFTIIENETPHNPVFLNAPDYTLPSQFYKYKTGTYPYINDFDALDYHANAAAIKQVGRYLDYLKENNVYDNTRIIIVADHGYYHSYPAFSTFKTPTIPAGFNPLFIVKDFYSKGKITFDNSLMTNADTLFFAKKDLPISNKNPFTKKELKQKKDEVYVWQSYNEEGNVMKLKGKTQFTLKQGWKVKDNIFNPDNWEPIMYEDYLKESGGSK